MSTRKPEIACNLLYYDVCLIPVVWRESILSLRYGCKAQWFKGWPWCLTTWALPSLPQGNIPIPSDFSENFSLLQQSSENAHYLKSLCKKNLAEYRCSFLVSATSTKCPPPQLCYYVFVLVCFLKSFLVIWK